MLTDIAYIGLGSNLNNPEEQIKQALRKIHEATNICIKECAHLYQSTPMGPKDQPDFINSVCKVATALSPIELLDLLQDIEKSQNRSRSGDRWGPRTIDLDILFFNQLSLDETRLSVPHPGIKDREFVLVPLFEIEPDMLMPDGRALAQWISECDLHGMKRLDTKIDFESIAA